jgi:UDP-N-acetylmuramate--alanine ligase
VTIYCSGIGGIGLSAYAALQRAAGHTVLGSDRAESALIEDLRGQGIQVTLDQSGAAIPATTDLFVYSEAIPKDAPERLAAEERGIPQRSYPEALGDLSRQSRVIAVCGTHGKSSTTAMAARALVEAGLDPTVVVGTKMRELGNRNWRRGKGPLFLLEACEYRRSFLQYSPSIVILTNCDGDHFDYYATLDEYQDAYVEFLRKLPSDGIVITHRADPQALRVAERSGKNIIDADAFALPELSTPGEHMQRNAQLALALAAHLGVPEESARASLRGYAGSWRRMEVKGRTSEGALVIDDYGHHPHEIRTTLRALRETFPTNRLVCVFQPHTHDRTLKLYDKFTPSFRDVDIVIVPNVYDARSDIETDMLDIPRFVLDITRESETPAMHSISLEETERLLRDDFLKPDDVLICMGAGDVTDLAERIVVR